MNDFLSRLREYDQALDRTHMRPRAAWRTRRALTEQSPTKQSPYRPWLLGGIALLPIGTALLWFGISRTNLGAQATASTQTATEGCVVQTRANNVRYYVGRCDLQLPQMNVRSLLGSELEEAAGTVRVHFGTARFSVTPVKAGDPPVRVAVAGGEIRVLGTTFDVTQTETGGGVLLHEGRIRFVPHLGTERVLEPGQQLNWKETSAPTQMTALLPVVSPAEDALEPAESFTHNTQHSSPQSLAVRSQNMNAIPTTPPAPLSGLEQHGAAPSSRVHAAVSTRATDLQSVPALVTSSAPTTAPTVSLEQVIQLRAEGQYRAALALVEQLYAQAQSSRDREVLSYERGTLLERVGAIQAACTHWQAHQVEFTNGRYATTVSQRLARCPSELPNFGNAKTRGE